MGHQRNVAQSHAHAFTKMIFQAAFFRFMITRLPEKFTQINFRVKLQN